MVNTGLNSVEFCVELLNVGELSQEVILQVLPAALIDHKEVDDVKSLMD